MSTAHRIVFAIGALIAIAFVGALVGSHDARSAERELAGVITFQCSNENDIKLAAHAAERGNTDVLRKLHQSSSCQGRKTPAAPAFFQSENVEWRFSTENVKGGAPRRL